MDKLKTLKDFKGRFEEWDIDLQNEGYARNDGTELYFDLRQEAIKWVKAFDDLENNPDLKKFHGDEEECWIKHFFSITEEDLE